ncbi:hypothetical protein YC2023_076803 [Brassica napus]
MELNKTHIYLQSLMQQVGAEGSRTQVRGVKSKRLNQFTCAGIPEVIDKKNKGKSILNYQPWWFPNFSSKNLSSS